VCGPGWRGGGWGGGQLDVQPVGTLQQVFVLCFFVRLIPLSLYTTSKSLFPTAPSLVNVTTLVEHQYPPPLPGQKRRPHRMFGYIVEPQGWLRPHCGTVSSLPAWAVLQEMDPGHIDGWRDRGTLLTVMRQCRVIGASWRWRNPPLLQPMHHLPPPTLASSLPGAISTLPPYASPPPPSHYTNSVRKFSHPRVVLHVYSHSRCRSTCSLSPPGPLQYQPDPPISPASIYIERHSNQSWSGFQPEQSLI